MASGMTSAKRFAVRTALVTGTTLATIIGAQNLATLDLQKSISATATAQALNLNTTTIAQPTTAPTAQPVLKVPPSIVIVRHPGEASTAANAPTQQTLIQPPAAVVIQPPAPVVVQQSAPIIVQQMQSQPMPSTHSSR